MQLHNSGYGLAGDGPHDAGEQPLPGSIAEFPTEPIVVAGQSLPYEVVMSRHRVAQEAWKRAQPKEVVSKILVGMKKKTGACA